MNSLTTINPLFLLGPIVLTVVVVTFFGWQREMKKRRAIVAERERARLEQMPNARLPEGALAMDASGVPPAVRDGLAGTFMLVAIGSFGANQLSRLLNLLAGCHLDRLVGSILVIENDVQLRALFTQRLPDVFRDRIVYAFSETFAGGFVNRPISWALDRIEEWGVPIVQGAEDVIDTQLRRNKRSPSEILVFQSLGGQSGVGLPAIAKIQERFEETLMVAFTALPRQERLRAIFAELKPQMEARGCFGWVLEDNLGADTTTTDYGMVALIVGLIDAPLHADQATRLNNTLSLALTKEPGAILIYQVVTSNVVAWPYVPVPGHGPGYYVYKQPVVEQALKALRKSAAGQGLWSAALPVGEAHTSTFETALISLVPTSLIQVEDDVRASLELRARTQMTAAGSAEDPEQGMCGPLDQANYELSFASISTTVDVHKPTCPLIVVRLTAVRDGARLVDEIVKVPQARIMDSGPSRPKGLPLPARNGHAARAESAHILATGQIHTTAETEEEGQI